MDLPATVHDFVGLELPPDRDLHLCIGMFDGVHLGHQAVVESAVHSARRVNGIAGVLTFDPHPSRLFRPDNPTLLIQSPRTKIRILRGLGVAIVIVKAFTAEFATVSAANFPCMLKEHLPNLRALYVGENFRFGQKRAGSVQTLIDYGRRCGVNVISSNRLKHNGEPISSTRVRRELTEGRIGHANDLLGYCYFSEGRVVSGRQQGRKLGFPTLNLPWEPELRPRMGVYAVRVQTTEGGQSCPGVANYGVKPTVGEEPTPLLEIHLLDDTTLTTGDFIRVEWLHFLRGERKFESLDQLREQIARDKEEAARFFKEGGRSATGCQQPPMEDL